MTTKFDSVFTDRVDGNKNSQGLTIFNLSSVLNSKYWIEIKYYDELDKINKSSFFFKIKEFTPDNSKIIIEAINSKKDVFFDINGNLTIRENNNQNVTIFQWINFLSNAIYTAAKFDNIFKQNDAIEANQNRPLARTDFIISNGSKWILYTTNSICYILYNPMHRKSFKNFYDTTLTNLTEFQDSTGNISSLFNMYCNIQKKKHTSEYDVNQYSDRSCNCIIQEDGIDDVTGVRLNETNYRSEIKDIYFCKAPSCDSTNLEVTTDSFMEGTKSYKQRRIKRIDGCPSANITICNSVIQSQQGNTNLVGTKIYQECGGKPQTQTQTNPQTQTQTNPDSPDPYSIVDFSYISFFVKSNNNLINNQDFKDKIIQNLLNSDTSLRINDIKLEITDLSNQSYKIDFTLSKTIQMIKINKVSNIFTSRIINDFNITTAKEFEISDVVKSTTSTIDEPVIETGSGSGSGSNLILILIGIFAVIFIIIVIVIIFLFN